MNTHNNVQDEIIEALKMNPEDIPTQDSLPPEQSPLNYPVAEKHFEDPPREEEPTKETDNGHAMMMAEVILGAANNIIEVGSGFFIKIKTDPSFLDYEELIQVIEEQNQRNIKRMTLDEGDKAMLRPLLAEVLKARQKVLSPEHQLLIAGVSILIKKAQMVMEVRAENQILTERIRGIIQQEAEAEPKRNEPFQTEREPEFVASPPHFSQDQEMVGRNSPISKEQMNAGIGPRDNNEEVHMKQEDSYKIRPIGEIEDSQPDNPTSDQPEKKLSRQERRKDEREAKKTSKISDDLKNQAQEQTE